MRRRAIRDLPFRHNTKPALGFEILSLANIFERADRGAIDHPLEAPQRPEFHSIYVGTRGKGKLVVDFTPTPLGAGYMTFVARGRVHQFVPDRTVDAALLRVLARVSRPRSARHRSAARAGRAVSGLGEARARDRRRTRELVAARRDDRGRACAASGCAPGAVDPGAAARVAAPRRAARDRTGSVRRRRQSSRAFSPSSKATTCARGRSRTTRSKAGMSPRALGELLDAPHRPAARSRSSTSGSCSSSSDFSPTPISSVKELADRAASPNRRTWSSSSGSTRIRRLRRSAARFHHPDADPDLVRAGVDR